MKPQHQPLTPTIQHQPKQDFSYTDIAHGIANGSWAVLLAVVVLYLTFKKPITKYFERHIALLETMRETLERNAIAIEGLRKTDEEAQATITTLTKRLPVIEERTEEILEAVYRIQDCWQPERPSNVRRLPSRRWHDEDR